jgi:hypothetical protein
MGKKAIPDEVRKKVETIVERFNRRTFPDGECYYLPRFRGPHCYLDRCEFGKTGEICRITYTGKIDDWDFAIFRRSREKYDPGEWCFTGNDLVDGTVLGALKAGLEAYPA